METFLRDYETLGMKFTAKHILIGAMRQLPVIFRKTFGQLALMLHYCVNGERLSYHQLAFLVDQELDEDKDTAPAFTGYPSAHQRADGISAHRLFSPRRQRRPPQIPPLFPPTPPVSQHPCAS